MKRKPRLTAAQCDRARRLSEVHPRYVVAEMIGVAPATILAAEKRDWKPASRLFRPIPNDWGIVAPGRTLPWLTKHYRTSMTVVMRWRCEKPVAVPYNGGRTWEPPADFAETLERMSARAAAKHYGVSENTIAAARLRLGIHPRQVAARRSIGWAERRFIPSGAPSPRHDHAVSPLGGVSDGARAAHSDAPRLCSAGVA